MSDSTGKKGRGRPGKAKADEKEAASPKAEKKAKKVEEPVEDVDAGEENGAAETKKRGRGRPPKAGVKRPAPQRSGKGRGRPPKNAKKPEAEVEVESSD